MADRIITFSVLILFLCGMSCSKGKDKPQSDTSPDASATFNVDDAFNSENEFLGIGVPQFGDLDSMIARRRIRALVPYTSYVLFH